MGKDFGYCALVAVLALVLTFGLTRKEYLEVRDAPGRLLLRAALPQGGSFGIGFIHSVAKSPVEDWFSPRESGLALDRTLYQDFGAGLPHAPEAGQTMSFHNGWVEIRNYNMALPRLEVRVGRVAQHSLLLPHSSYDRLPLSSLAPPGAALIFSVHVRTGFAACVAR